MGNSYIPFLILLLIILGQSCVLLWMIFKTRQRTHHLSNELQQSKNEAQSSRDETDRLKDRIQQLVNEIEDLKLSQAKLRNRLDESDRKSEEDRKTLKMLMISDLHNDIDTLDKKGSLDEKLNVLLSRVKENISKTEDV